MAEAPGATTPAGATAWSEWPPLAAAAAAFCRRFAALQERGSELTWVVFRHGTVAAVHPRDPRPEFGGFGPAEDALAPEWLREEAPSLGAEARAALAPVLDGIALDNRVVWALQEGAGPPLRQAFAALLGPGGGPGPPGGPARATPLGGGLWLVHFPDLIDSPALFSLAMARGGEESEGVRPEELLPGAAAAARLGARRRRLADRAMPEAAFAVDKNGALHRWTRGGFVPDGP